MAGDFIQRSRHGTVYYFRRRVPGDLQQRMGRRHLYMSLRTEELAEAKRRARALAATSDRLFHELRYMPCNNDSKALLTDYGLAIDLDALTGKRKRLVITDIKPGEHEEVQKLVESLSASGTPLSNTATPTILEAISEVMASPDLKGRTKKEYGRIFERFAKFAGKETRLADIGQGEFAKYADSVIASPTWSDKTKNLNIVAAARLFNFFMGRNSAVPSINTKGLKVKRTSPAGHDRDAYSLDDMRVLFENAARYREKHPCKWWVTVVPAFLGCRVEELAQAHLSGDFEVDPSTGAMILRIDETERGGREVGAALTKSVKTLAGWRKVPIHPALVDAGFMRFLDAERMAGARTPFERHWKPWRDAATGSVTHSHSIVKWGSRELQGLRKAGVIRGKQSYFHSLRHTFVTLLATAGVSEEWRAGLAGQAHGGVNSQVYNKAREEVRETLPIVVNALRPLEALLREFIH